MSTRKPIRKEVDPFSRASEARRKWRDRIAQPQLRLTNATTGGPPYTAPELRAHVRPGALDASVLPSRVGKRRFYPDGRVGKV